MTDIEILQLADSCGVMAVTNHEWDGKQFNHTDDYLDGDAAALVIFARELMKKREWVGLTGDEIDVGLVCSNYAFQMSGAWRDGVEWATKQLKEKNT